MKGKVVEVVPGTHNLKRLAAMYGVCSKTMAKQIKAIAHELGDRDGRRLFYIREVEIIFRYYGTPKTCEPAEPLRSAA